MSRKVLSLVLFAAAAIASPVAAHGPTPDTVEVLLRAAAPSEVVLATNFGVIVSRDGGATWEWICEDAFGSYAVSRYAMGPDGALYVATLDGLFAGNASTCGFAKSTGVIAGHDVVDVAADPTDARHVYAVGLLLVDGGASTAFSAFESMDGGATFTSLPALPAGFRAQRGVLRVAADGQSLYLPGYVEEAGLSSPRIAIRPMGASGFSAVDLSALGMDSITRIHVDPADARHLFFVASGAQEDVLFESRAAGAAPVERLRMRDYLLGFAFGATAQTVFVGARDGQALFRSDDAGTTFVKMTGAPRFRCLATQGSTLWGCTDWENDGYALGRSGDSGATWTAALRFEDVPDRIAGCLSGGCQFSSEWLCSMVCRTPTDGGGFPGPEIRPESPDPRDGATDSEPDAPDAAQERPDKNDDGCLCAAAPAGGGRAGAAVAVAVMAFGVARRRRGA